MHTLTQQLNNQGLKDLFINIFIIELLGQYLKTG